MAAGTRKGRNKVEEPGKDFRFASAMALCQKRREKAAQAAAGRQEERGTRFILTCTDKWRTVKCRT